MAEGLPTWIVVERDVSDSVAIQGQRRSVLAMVLDADTGLIVNSTVGTEAGDVVRRALKSALSRPAGGLSKTVPGRIVCHPALSDAVTKAVATLSWLADASIVEGVEMWASEEVLDAAVGHIEGRVQSIDEPPDVGDWKLVYRVLEEFVAAAPWSRWSDTDYFLTTLHLDGEIYEWTSIVLGAAGIQRGFNVLADPQMLERASAATGSSLKHLEASLIVHLESGREVRGLFADKAVRYGWPPEVRLVPRMLTVRGGEPADFSRTDVRLLALAAQGVLLQDAKRLAAADASPIEGELRFEDGAVGRYEVSRPA